MKPIKRSFVTALALAALTASAWAETAGIRRSSRQRRCRCRRTSTFRSHSCRCSGSERCSGHAATPDRSAHTAIAAAAGPASRGANLRARPIRQPVPQQQVAERRHLVWRFSKRTATPAANPQEPVAQCEPNGGTADHTLPRHQHHARADMRKLPNLCGARERSQRTCPRPLIP